MQDFLWKKVFEIDNWDGDIVSCYTIDMLGLFFVWRAVDLIIAFIADKMIKSSGEFQLPLKPIDRLLQIPSFIQDSGNFDGEHYLRIAKNGYSLYEQAFFPLFPLLIHAISFLTRNYFISGFILSNLCFLTGLIVFKKYLENIGKSPKEIVWIFLFLLSFPTSFFFGSVYTESMFFLFLTSAFFFMQKRQYWIVAICSILAALTRFMGVFLCVPFLCAVASQQQQLYQFWRKKKLAFANLTLSYGKIFIIMASPMLGLLMYMVYLVKSVYNPFAFYTTQSYFHAGRSTHALIFLPQVYYRYLNIFLRAQHNLVYFVAVVEFLIFNVVFVVLLYDLWALWKQKNNVNRMNLIGLNFFSLINILLPTLTGTLLSVPRFALLSLSFFIRLADIHNRAVKIILLILFFALSTILLALFTQGYFVS